MPVATPHAPAGTRSFARAQPPERRRTAPMRSFALQRTSAVCKAQAPQPLMRAHFQNRGRFSFAAKCLGGWVELPGRDPDGPTERLDSWRVFPGPWSLLFRRGCSTWAELRMAISKAARSAIVHGIPSQFRPTHMAKRADAEIVTAPRAMRKTPKARFTRGDLGCMGNSYSFTLPSAAHHLYLHRPR